MVTTQQADLLTITEAAKELGTTRGAPHYYRLTGKLPAVKVGRHYLVARDAVERLRRERDAQDEK